MRQTKASAGLTEIFRTISSPQTVQQLLAMLADRGAKVNKTTVYRQLESMVELNFIKEVSFGDGKQRYEMLSDHCHHHVVCDSCGKVEDIELDEEKIFKLVEKESAYLINRHAIEFFGLCNNCK